jgi:hypothetical protein
MCASPSQNRARILLGIKPSIIASSLDIPQTSKFGCFFYFFICDILFSSSDTYEWIRCTAACKA